MRPTLRLILPLVVLVAAALPAPAGAHHERTAGPVQLTAVEERLLDLLNRYRVEQGVRPVLPSLHLQAAARFYATDLATYDNVTLSHLDSRGELPHTRFARFGYPHPRATGENVAAGMLDPAATLRQWIDSAPHHETLVADEWTVIGVAVGGNPFSSSGNYWVTSFGVVDDSRQELTLVTAGDEVVAPLEPRVVVEGCAGAGPQRRCAPGRALALRAVGGRGRTGLEVEQRWGERWRRLPVAGPRHAATLGRGQLLRVRGRAVTRAGETVGPWIVLRAEPGLGARSGRGRGGSRAP
jgi:uncharacterized protein YkwD